MKNTDGKKRAYVYGELSKTRNAEMFSERKIYYMQITLPDARAIISKIHYLRPEAKF